MSARVRWQRDGETVTGYRKTDRRNPRRSVLERVHAFNMGSIGRQPPQWCPEIRVCFLLPRWLQPFVRSGKHGLGINVIKRSFVQVTSGSSEQCFKLAQDFLTTVARDRPAFTTTASVISCQNPDRSYGRHLTWCPGPGMVVSGGIVEPQVFEAA